MRVPGLADPAAEAGLLDRDAEREESQRLLEELRNAVQADVREIGTLRREMRVTVPGAIIADHIARNMKELRQDAAVPGFRKGRAPIGLIQKRFGSEVRESLKSTLVGQSFFAAAEKEKLDVLGDPLFHVGGEQGTRLVDFSEAVALVKLPESGDFTYSVELEIRPSFELPELKGIEIAAPRIEITDEMIQEEVNRQRRVRGRYEPVEGAAADKDDLLVVDVILNVDGNEVKREENLELGVRPTRLDGIPLMDLETVLRGAKSGDERRATGTVPDDYERADLRGKKAEFVITVHEVKRLVPAELSTLVEQAGAESQEQYLRFVREDMEADRDLMIERAKKAQVLDYVLKNTNLDLPEKLSARMVDRAVMRRVVEMQEMGVPLGDIETRIDELRTSARDQVLADLKTDFILAKVAEQLSVEVTDEEVNNAIAKIARRYNRRFDRARDELLQRGLLPQLTEQIRHDKCISLLLADAKLVEKRSDTSKAEPPAKARKPAKAKAAPKTADNAGEAETEAPAKPKARSPRKKKE